MKTRAVIGGFAAALAMSVPTTLAMAGTASADDEPKVPEVTVHESNGVNGVEVGYAIEEIREKGRGEFTQKAVDAAFEKDGGDYNVLIQNLQHGDEETANLQGKHLYASIKFGATNYGLWIFDSGEWTNGGDGGYINWAFQGWYDREGNTVTFHRP